MKLNLKNSNNHITVFYFDTVVEYTNYALHQLQIDAVGLTIFHASQNAKSRISPTRKKRLKT